MTPNWQHTPQQKVEAGGVEIQGNTISTTVYRPENAVSRATITANNNQGINYIENLDAFTTLKISYRYGSESWTKVFEGPIEKATPSTDNNHLVSATAYGYGRALRNTHGAYNYGLESDNPATYTPYAVINAVINFQVEKAFGPAGAATGYDLTLTDTLNMANPTISHIKGGYRKCIDIINEALLFYQAYQDGAAGAHWFVDPDGYFRTDQIANHTVDTTDWPTWWRTDETGSTLNDGDYINAEFTKNVQGYANKILLFTDLRKPTYDYWTEDSGGASLWGNNGFTSVTDDNTAGYFVVGSHSLHLLENGGAPGYAYYPSTQDAGWDFSTIGSEKSPTSINFYIYPNQYIYAATTAVRLFTTNYNSDYFYCNFMNNTNTDKWTHFSIPTGPYWTYASPEEDNTKIWSSSGSPDWTDINGICFFTYWASGSPAGNGEIWLDDLHLTGKIIREAYDSDEITAYNEHQKIIHMETTANDSMKASDDSGTAARLAYAELLNAKTIPTVGQIIIPLSEDILPGQLIHCNYNKQLDGTYRVDSNFRVQQIIHNFQFPRPTTTLDLTSDLVNTFAKGHDASPSSLFSALHKVMYVDPEAKSLKTTGIDELVARLSVDYA